MEAGDIEVYKPESGQGAAKSRLVPEILKPRYNFLKIIDIPVIRPREDDQEKANFKREQREADP